MSLTAPPPDTPSKARPKRAKRRTARVPEPPSVAPSAAQGRAPAKAWNGAPFTCLEVRDEAEGVKTFVLAPQDGSRVRFHAGQNLTIAWTVPDGSVLHRTFTIASSPAARDHVALTVKAHPGGRVTQDMHARLRPGMSVEASGIGGRFGLAFHPAKRICLIGAGSGLTPMMAMLRLIRDRRHDVDVSLIQCARTPADLLFTEELAAITAAHPSVSVINLVDSVPAGAPFIGPRGRLTRALIHALVPDARTRTAFVCGPPPFMDAVTRALRAEGCDGGNIHTERFSAAPPAPPAEARAGTRHTVTLVRSGRVLEVPAEQTLLSALTAAGVPARSGCQLGLCGTCRVRRLGGQVAMSHQGGLTPEEEDAGDILACRAYATGAVTLDL